jgi:hypothetical protein
VGHVTDEELLLDYYGEIPGDAGDSMREHLRNCAQCRALDRELRGVLALVDNEPVPAAPEGFEREMWSRVEPHITKAVAGDVVTGNLPAASEKLVSAWSLEVQRWALAAAAVALAAGSFALGRVWDEPSDRTGATVDDERAATSLLLRSEIEEHLERSQRMLVELVNTDETAPVTLASDRERAADLVAAGRLYRRSIDDRADAETRDLLEAVERVLVEIANGPERESSNELSEVRARISDQDLIFRLRLMTAEMRARDQRARSAW